jgi:cephalosporin hydroxylase
MPAQISSRILAFHFPCAFCEMKAAVRVPGSAVQQHNAMPALSTGNPEVLVEPPDGSVCCYHPAVRSRRRERVERMPWRTDLALSRGEAAHGANYVDRNAVLRVAAAIFESGPTPWGFAKKVATAILAHYFYQPTGSESEEYHKCYYNTFMWKKTTWMGVDCWKSVSDMWNYQEILFELKPSLVIEFGTYHGGSALFFASAMRQIGKPFKVLSVDINQGRLDPAARCDSDILFVESRSTAPAIAERIQRLKSEFPGKIFAILDSDHSMNHVLAEMKLLRPLLSAGDYLIVEDSMLNGHPILPGWGPGPYEAIEAYEHEFPNDYTHDVARDNKFGWTFAPNGYLIRT